MSTPIPALIRAEMAQLAESMRAAGWDAKALVVEQGDGTILVNLSAWLSWHPASGADAVLGAGRAADRRPTLPPSIAPRPWPLAPSTAPVPPWQPGAETGVHHD
jgi:hypothetical protein